MRDFALKIQSSDRLIPGQLMSTEAKCWIDTAEGFSSAPSAPSCLMELPKAMEVLGTAMAHNGGSLSAPPKLWTWDRDHYDSKYHKCVCHLFSLLESHHP